jgi:hypothetical protein
MKELLKRLVKFADKASLVDLYAESLDKDFEHYDEWVQELIDIINEAEVLVD